jgi:hypothetical protein
MAKLYARSRNKGKYETNDIHAILAFKELSEFDDHYSDSIQPHELPRSASCSGWMRTDFEAQLLDGEDAVKFKIEDGIPITGRGHGLKNEQRTEMLEAIAELSTGQSFLVPVETRSDVARVHGTIQAAKKLHSGKHFISRKSNDGIRIWRLE